jgi:hypothetical protein
MASSGNFCTLNRLAQLGTSTDASTRAGSMSNGNLKYVNLSNNTAVGNFGVTSGKWYYEVYISSFSGDNGMAIGWANDLFNLDAELGYNSPSSPSGGQAFGLYMQDQKLIYGPGDGGSSYNKTYGSGTPTDGDIIRIWLDADNGRFWAGLNGTIWGSGDPSAGSNWGFGTGGSPHNVAISSRTLYPAIGNWSAADATVIFNFGQDSTFQGAVSAGGNADGNGFGDFKYDPDGFLALCSANVPTSDDIDPAQTDDSYSGKNFNAVLYTGNGNSAARTIDGFNFSPDFIWVKSRSGAKNHMLVDSSRGGDKYMYSQANNAELTASNMITFGDSDGYVMRDDGTYLNENSGSYVVWGWRANGGTTSSNSSGDITSTVQANTKAGFSIVTYTGNGSSAQSIGHGLSSGAPEFILVKNRSQADDWAVYHASNGNDAHMILNSNAGKTTSSAYWGSFTPTTSIFKVGSDHKLNASGENYVAYCWAPVSGYSAFGNYVANTNDDGPFVYTGFRPRMVFIKMTVTGDGWAVWDTERSTFNVMDDAMRWNLTNAETNGTAYQVDFLSNGFKVRTSNAQMNHSSYDPYIWGAWGDVPFKYNNTF